MARYNLTEMCEKFEEKLNELLPSERERSIVFTPQEYLEMVEMIKTIKRSHDKSVEDILRLRCYDVIKIRSVEKLYFPSAPPDPVQYYVHTEEMFNILYDIHVNTDHGQLEKMLKVVKQKYNNISKRVITIFLETCEKCKRKDKPENILKSVMKNYLEMRGQVDFVDMTLFDDRYHKFMLIYRDENTKFILLRPMNNLDIIEIAHLLVDIFAMFGAPSVLQSHQNRFFLNQLILEINAIWPHLIILHGQVKNPRFDLTLDLNPFDEVQEFVKSWYEQSPQATLADAIRFAQMMINKIQTHHLACTPFETMFRKKMQFGLPRALWDKVPDGLLAEEDVERYVEANWDNI